MPKLRDGFAFDPGGGKKSNEKDGTRIHVTKDKRAKVAQSESGYAGAPMGHNRLETAETRTTGDDKAGSEESEGS